MSCVAGFIIVVWLNCIPRPNLLIKGCLDVCRCWRGRLGGCEGGGGGEDLDLFMVDGGFVSSVESEKNNT